MIFQAGTLNPTSLIVPDLYVQIVPPKITQLNGVPTNILGIIGTATWGPKNSPVTISDMAGYAAMFGPIKTTKYDLGTAVAVSVMQGANNIRCIRVTDGTDTAATSTIVDGAAAIGVTLTSKYTGTGGNGISRTVSAGTKANTFKVAITMPGRVPEVFDNIGGAGTTFWANVASAINEGQSGVRGPSEIVVATTGPSADATPVLSTAALAGGTDGNTTITSAVLLGSDAAPRTGMYALRGTGASVAFLADVDDSTSWATQITFGLAEGVYMIGVGPVGQTIAAAITAKTTAGADSYAFKPMLGDYIYFLDTINNVTRLVSPQGFVAGRLVNLSPEQSALNKPIYGIVGTQATYSNKVYSNAELGQLAAAGIDVITNPVPGGNYFGCRIGHNSSSDPSINGDNYTRMTNYIAGTLNAGMGRFVGRLQTTEEREEAWATLDGFLLGMEDNSMIGDPNGGPAYQITLDSTNNPSDRVALGYQVADVKVRYLSVVEKFIINVEGGTTVQISRA